MGTEGVGNRMEVTGALVVGYHGKRVMFNVTEHHRVKISWVKKQIWNPSKFFKQKYQIS